MVLDNYDSVDAVITDTSSELSSILSNPSELLSDRNKEKKRRRDTSTVARTLIDVEDDDTDMGATCHSLRVDQEKEDSDNQDDDEVAQTSLMETYIFALCDLQYDNNPTDRPHWLTGCNGLEPRCYGDPRWNLRSFLGTLDASRSYVNNKPNVYRYRIGILCAAPYTGLNKPLPHPSLTSLEDHEVLTRFWVNEIERLEYLRSKRCPPEGQPTDGKWHYKHYGETIEVRRPALSGIGTPRTVYARGCWEYVVRGKKVWRGLDEWPMTLEGETLGWGTGVLQDHNKEERLRAEQLPKGEEE
ncbi:hypothetical protein L13192_05381 [Pyrenophora tritici-repentis]|uniref:Uncharacterized protein n=1 Tax=Pyrenophora tritici-repentis TaxID=45151 RepID=A0A922NAF3_9PLEO|nr:hypothetical protein Ptr86124_010406 [Pyrenophora tritici-repentis]KAI1669865.1 hypothetical protein L13192_05381 [Pyrenophora tritici-repentis]KAI1681455.1 hypothetical protein KJE20_08326 [Pyrenophora tritici-repentis]